MKLNQDLRKPTKNELEQLAQFTSTQYGYSADKQENLQEAQNLVNQAYIAVFDNYVGSIGYTGKIMTVVWDGSPCQYATYTWNRVTNLLELENQEI